MSVATEKRRSAWIRGIWGTNVGKKYVAAVSGAILVAYVILHMVGNLNAFAGAGDGEARIDSYAEWLREFGEPLLPHAFVLWVVRVVLLAALVLHVTSVAQLRRASRQARGPYPARRIGRTFSAATMVATGGLLLAFIIFHILQFTTLTIDVTPLESGAVYANLYWAFQKWYFVVLYVLAVSALGFHLRHAVWSMFQSLGLDSPRRNRRLRTGATVVAVVLTVGFAAVPVAFISGALPEPADQHAAALVTSEASA